MKFKDTELSSVSVPKFSKNDNLADQSKNIIADDQAPEKPKKRKAKDPEKRHDTSQKKGKKRKKRDAEELQESVEHKAQSEEAEGASEPPKKKHKNRTIFADPKEDTELNTQSRKALEYVFTQMNRPSRWKFNKARQNWLIRNIWSSETVPDIYFPLVLKYLANVQGGSREKLRETCQTYLTAKAILVEAPLSTPLAEADIKPTKPTPGPLVTPSSQPTPGAIVPAAATTSTLIPTSDAAIVLASIRRVRAQSLLDVLT
ncbi:hypothetical protein BYT27DRAFT_7171242 [Phlegmacium glaucopus]|nr:hypothetical protein BYT27DRAFT_7171242 [Phlegmacium glaucopus]